MASNTKTTVKPKSRRAPVKLEMALAELQSPPKSNGHAKSTGVNPLLTKTFDYLQPTKLIFGPGQIARLGDVVAQYGKRCLLVTTRGRLMGSLYARAKMLLNDACVAVEHFDGVVPNPTTDVIAEGARRARAHKADVILGLGGGSAIDAAKAIAVESVHEGSCWDYLFYKKQPTRRTLPIVAVSTASGSGSHVTQVSVVTNTANRDKSALYNPILFPKAAILDPELMLKLPTELTATSGFDIFCHAFESLLHGGASAYTEMLGWEAIRLVHRHLPQVLRNGTDVAARSALVWGDTLAGLCIANAGVTLPHGIAMAIGGMYPHVAHGEALAMIYPACARYTRSSAVRQFATAARIFDPRLAQASDRDAAGRCCDLLDEFLRKIGLWMGLSARQISREELPLLARQSMVLPDYKNNPRVTSPQEMLQLLEESYQRN